MLRRGGDLNDLARLHQELSEAWQPDDVMQTVLVNNIAEKSFDIMQLRTAWMNLQLTSLSDQSNPNQTTATASATPAPRRRHSAGSAHGTGIFQQNRPR
jgi:hypothetical protein